MNRLAKESSAYLRQHARNPVDWWPWGPEALEHARATSKPLLVSIGYSSCHWCHVMERESFEDPTVAQLMNERLVCIKVDREERPDVDQIYMEAVMRLTGHGGWPLNMFCTPDGRPFFGGTYFPPRRAHGRPSWAEVVAAVTQLWREQPAKVEEQATHVLDVLRARPQPGATTQFPGVAALETACIELMRRADPVHGGFGSAPKFPTPTNLELLLLAGPLRARGTGVIDHVLLTLHRMARGGIYDQLGGGFHRYSTDERWLVPHFEKMLYDQGQLLRVYAETLRQTGDAELCWPIEETITYLERELRSPEGGFRASQDADSEGVEGRFYVWNRSEIDAVLGPEDGPAFCDAYGVTAGGTFEHGGQSVLEHALAGARPRFAAQRAKLLEARSRRVAPDTDGKHVGAWIGYTISGIACASGALHRADWLAAAERAARFVSDHLHDAEGNLLRVWENGTAKIPGFLDDHAARLTSLLDLVRAGGDLAWLAEALRVAEQLVARFYDRDQQLLFFAPSSSNDLVLRPDSDSDGATPSAEGLAVLGLVRLAALSGRTDLRDVAESVLRQRAASLQRLPAAFPTLVRAAALAEAGVSVAVVRGEVTDPTAQALAARARELLCAEDFVIRVSPGAAAPAGLSPEWLEGRDAKDGVATAYLCRGTVCSLPATSPEALSLP